jgi:hypothetical protein
MKDDRPGTREGFNRLMRLGSYALGVVLAGILLFNIYTDAFGDFYGMSIFAAAILICFAIGYTTNKKT